MAKIYYFGSAGYYQVQNGEIVRLNRDDPEVAKAKASDTIIHGVQSATAEAPPAPVHIEPVKLEGVLCELQIAIAKLTPTIDSLKSYLEEPTKHLEEILREDRSITDEILKDLGQQITELARVYADNDQVKSLAQQFADLLAEVKQVKAEVAKLTSAPTIEELQTLRHDLVLANAEIGSLQEKLTEAQANLSTDPAAIMRLQSELTAAREEVTRLEHAANPRRVGELETQVSTLTVERDAALRKVADAEGATVKANSTIADLDRQLKAEKLRTDEYANKVVQFGDPEVLKKNLETLRADFTTKTGEAKKAADRVTELEAQLKAQPANPAGATAPANLNSWRSDWKVQGGALVATLLIGFLLYPFMFGWGRTAMQSADLAPLQRQVAQVADNTKNLQPTLNGVQSEMRTGFGEVKEAIAKIPQPTPASTPAPVAPPPVPAVIPDPTVPPVFVPKQPVAPVLAQVNSAKTLQQVANADPRCNNVPGLVWINQIHNCAPWPPSPRR